ncbi:MAG: RDD family protein [Vicinamibacterales bacterium]
MKCPKCGYLGYAQSDRCRNCSYEFALSEPDVLGELRLNDRAQVPEPLRDLDMVDAADRFAPIDEALSGPPTTRRRRPETPNPIAELPLFGSPITDDVPLITKASPPRQPLSVRRATPDVPRLRTERAPMLDWAEAAPQPVPTPQRVEVEPAPHVAAAPRTRTPDTRTPDATPAPRGPEPAGVGPRALATTIDVLLLLAVDLLVVYFTLKICRVSLAELAILPKAPLLAFLLLQNGGYVVAFTATGQTLGKMIAGVRVLAADADHAPDVGQSVLRAGFWLLLALPAGLGLLATALMRDGRGLHDRFAGTRVVRASA